MKTKKQLETAIKFHRHLDNCEQCHDHPFELCTTGIDLLIAAVSAIDSVQEAEHHELQPVIRRDPPAGT